MQTPPEPSPAPSPAPPAALPAPRTATRRPAHRTKLFAVLLVLGVITSMFMRSRWEIEGPSMEPTLPHGTTILVAPTWLRAIRLGDIVVARSPEGGTIAKRVVGLAGDRMAWGTQGLVRNGSVLSSAPGTIVDRRDEYGDISPMQCIRERIGPATFWTVQDAAVSPYTSAERVVPAGQVYLAGDHRDRSNDSRYWGSIPLKSIVGVVVHVFGDPPQTCD